MKLKLTHIDTGGHGYLSVSKEIIKELGLVDEISGYSGMNQTRVFLEEDCDASLFIDRAKERGYEVEVKSSYNPKHKCTHNYNPIAFELKVGDELELWTGSKAIFEGYVGSSVKLQGYNKISYSRLLRLLK